MSIVDVQPRRLLAALSTYDDSTSTYNSRASASAVYMFLPLYRGCTHPDKKNNGFLQMLTPPPPPPMTILGFPGLSSQSVSGFSVLFGQKTSKWSGMTRLGFPSLSSQSVSRFSGRKGLKNPETDWDDNPGKPMLVIPVHFGVFWPKRRLGFPGLSSAACPNSRKKASKRPLVARSQKSASFNSNSHIGKPLVCRGPESRQKASQRPPVAVASFISNSHTCWETAF